MRTRMGMQQRRLHVMARFCAFSVLVSSIAACSRQKQEAPEPAPSEPVEIPHFIPPKASTVTRSHEPDSGSGGTASRTGEGGSGGAETLPDVAGCPPSMGKVGRVCIDRYEIVLVQKDSGEMHPHFSAPPHDLGNLVAESRPGVFPQGHLSQESAEKACRNAGKRLCTLDEWQAACSGSGARQFPYGKESAEGSCNVNKRSPHILDKLFPDVPHLQRTGKHFNDPMLLLDPDYLERTGSRRDCVTPEGLFDMDGNLSEWVANIVQKPDGMHGTFAGDAFSGAGMQGCSRKTDAHVTNYLDYSMGTRCCADAKQ